MLSEHVIPVKYSILFQRMLESSFSDAVSDCIHQHSLLRPLLKGAPSGCCCFLYHLCWHGQEHHHVQRALLCLQNRKNALLSDRHWRQKTSQQRSRGRQRRMVTGDFELVHSQFLHLASSYWNTCPRLWTISPSQQPMRLEYLIGQCCLSHIFSV